MDVTRAQALAVSIMPAISRAHSPLSIDRSQRAYDGGQAQQTKATHQNER